MAKKRNFEKKFKFFTKKFLLKNPIFSQKFENVVQRRTKVRTELGTEKNDRKYKFYKFYEKVKCLKYLAGNFWSVFMARRNMGENKNSGYKQLKGLVLIRIFYRIFSSQFSKKNNFFQTKFVDKIKKHNFSKYFPGKKTF